MGGVQIWLSEEGIRCRFGCRSDNLGRFGGRVAAVGGRR
jgi:hypothetical protein